MSTWMCAPRARAARRIGRSRALTAAAEPSGSAGSSQGWSAEIFTETFTRGTGPHGAVSSRGADGQRGASRPSVSTSST